MAIDAQYSPFFRNSMSLPPDGNTTIEAFDLALPCSRLAPGLEEFQAYSNTLPAYDSGILRAQDIGHVPLPRKRFRGVDEQCSSYYGGMELNQQNLDLINDFNPVSTSGRDSLDLLKQLQLQVMGQQLDLHQLILSQAEQTRQGLQAKKQKHTRSLLDIVDKRFEIVLKEKEEELQRLYKRNAELEQVVRNVSLESSLWQELARSHDSLVLDLMASLEQAQYVQSKEGFGDSEAESIVCPSAENSSASFSFPKREGEGNRHSRVCRVCRKKEMCMLILPCRHLCLCRDCEQAADACPLCKSKKDASIEVYMV